MTNNKEFNYEDLEKRTNLACELIHTILEDLDLLISIKEENNIREIIFSDRTAYIDNNEKRAFTIEVKDLNAIVFNDIDAVPSHILKKYLKK